MHLSQCIKKICQDAYVSQSTTEAHHPWQNPAEHCIQELKKVAEFHMVQNEAPTQAWGFALLFGGWCLNHMVIKSLGVAPHEFMLGETPDLSVLQFKFWQRLKYLDLSSQYLSWRMKPGNFLDIAEYVGDAYTY